VAAYRLTIRRRGATDRERFATLHDALEALEARLDALAPTERRGRERAFAREYDAIQQVSVRGQLSGPRRLRAGVDLRGDGSAEAFTGHWRRRLVERRSGETAYEALRRVLDG
jgi:hypothetical protein